MKPLAIAAGLSLLLASCTSAPPKQITLEERLQNPLFAEQYGDLLVESLVELEIQNDPLLEDTGKKDRADDARREALDIAKEATKKQRDGTIGNFVPVAEFAKGEVLYLENTLYFGPTFEVVPGPDLWIYLTTLVDPRETAFPDETSIEVAGLESPYGDQWYPVKNIEDPLLYRTVVLFDRDLERIHGFAQLSK
jgi:hypothetical protein